MEIKDKLLKQIILPITKPYSKDREWFSNNEILSKLNKEELRIVEKQLIEILKTNDDTLIPETLIKLKSIDSIPIMLDKLKLIKEPLSRIKWASFINEIKNGDKEMEAVAFRELEKFEFIYEAQGTIFHDLVKFKSERINNLIKKFIDHKYFLVAHHAKLVLNYDGYVESFKKNIPTKKWWQFWR